MARRANIITAAAAQRRLNSKYEDCGVLVIIYKDGWEGYYAKVTVEIDNGRELIWKDWYGSYMAAADLVQAITTHVDQLILNHRTP